MKHILLLFSFVFFSLAEAQVPPPPATANVTQQKLINEFMEVSHYKEALINYAKDYLDGRRFDYDADPPKELFTEEQARSIIDHFDFEKLRFSLQSALSFIPEENLKALIQFYKGLNGKLTKDNSILLMSPVIDLNIKNQMSYAIENINKQK
ncbi:hypothetical protein JET18_14255 [Chryseobacterium sp. L7]|uniref:DUF2059 domain-containing protein n=1 Tax=Chryseobacterium endalhagicum TaxID=2797638 RepID=A0ABS1QJE5_9FLAO|nr:hypothetical protein [Chryseobacterium endalhagicum]MBL1222013.1 hypothetical protein [Chryseobacterium endalhagicum]